MKRRLVLQAASVPAVPRLPLAKDRYPSKPITIIRAFQRFNEVSNQAPTVKAQMLSQGHNSVTARPNSLRPTSRLKLRVGASWQRPQGFRPIEFCRPSRLPASGVGQGIRQAAPVSPMPCKTLRYWTVITAAP